MLLYSVFKWQEMLSSLFEPHPRAFGKQHRRKNSATGESEESPFPSSQAKVKAALKTMPAILFMELIGLPRHILLGYSN
jgi:hypothetical protein